MDQQPNENTSLSFFDRPGVQLVEIPVGNGVPLGFEVVSNPRVKNAGVYGAWGQGYDNIRLYDLIEQRLGAPLAEEEKMNLASLGFNSRHILPDLSTAEHSELEIEVGARLLKEAAHANGWETREIQAVLIGISAPLGEDYLETISERAGVPEQALKVSVYKACDGAMGALHLSLNPALALPSDINRNLANELRGKKVLVGAIEGLSRFVSTSPDKFALQLFGNGAGVIGLIPGETMKFLVGKTHEVFDEHGLLAVHMYYPHSERKYNGESNIDILQVKPNYIRVAGLMNEPSDGLSISMAGPMGMVKLFVRSGVGVVREVYHDYLALMAEQGRPDQRISVSVVHHANLKINQLKHKQLHDEGIDLDMPWLFTEFGNVSAASAMIAYLRHLPKINPGDHVMFDGFGAGTYYDVLVVEFPYR